MTKISVTQDVVEEIMEKKTNLLGNIGIYAMLDDKLLLKTSDVLKLRRDQSQTDEEGRENDRQTMWKNGVTMIYTHSA